MAIHLVTGGSGYVGSHIAKMLLARGEEVRVLDIFQDTQMPAPCVFIKGDVTRPDDVRRAVQGVDYVHHNAALVPLTKSDRLFQRVNFNGTKNVLDIAREENVKFISCMSSSAIFGQHQSCPIERDAPLAAGEAYGASKAEADWCAQTAIKAGAPVATIRPRTVLGGQRMGIFQILFEWIRDGADIYTIGDGRNVFQFVHVEDLAAVSIEACLQNKPGVYNVGAKEFGTLKEDLEFLIAHADSRSRVKALPVSLSKFVLKLADGLGLSPLAPYHYMTYGCDFYFDIKHLQEELGLTPKYGNRDLLTQSYDAFMRQAHATESGFEQTGAIHRQAVKQGILKILKFLS